MDTDTAIAKTEELLRQLRSYDGTKGGKAGVLRHLEEVRFAVHEPQDTLTFYTNKASISQRIRF